MQCYTRVLRDVAALEAGEPNLPDYAVKRLAGLRSELAEFEPSDKVTNTLAEKRRKASSQ